MNDRIRLLRVAYWVGAMLDGLVLVPMLVPAVCAAMFGIPNFQPGPDYRYATAVGAALMAGWTVLLIWADRRPLERRGVILITAVPVVIGMTGANLYGIASGLFLVSRAIPTMALQAAVFALFLVAWLRTRPARAETRNDAGSSNDERSAGT
jgi:hypothetical protein